MKKEIWIWNLKVLYVPVFALLGSKIRKHLDMVGDGGSWEIIDCPTIALLRIFNRAESVVAIMSEYASLAKDILTNVTNDAIHKHVLEKQQEYLLENQEIAAAIAKLSCVREGRVKVPEFELVSNLWDKRDNLEGEKNRAIIWRYNRERFLVIGG
ncbi:hypothetical protein DL98DRAFT_581766 [Cadophora sp. DSE1049]|nr:hypothetical protein DL98DRAFT_581766 [Cadophora sp. DSE1049]